MSQSTLPIVIAGTVVFAILLVLQIRLPLLITVDDKTYKAEAKFTYLDAILGNKPLVKVTKDT